MNITENDLQLKPSVEVGNFSKSLISMFKTCPLKAWNKQRSFESDETRALEVGKASHEYFAKNIAKRMKKRYKAYLPYSPDVLREAKSYADSINYEDLLKDSEIMFVEKRMNINLENGQSLIGINDLVLYESDEFFGDCVKIVDYKTAFNVSKEIDDEAIIYSFLAAKEFGLPVKFARVSGRSGDYWEHYFELNEALSYEDLIVTHIDHIKEILESDESPFPSVGPHCQNCPYLDQCIARRYDPEDIDDMIAQQGLLDKKAKQLKAEIKALAFEKGDDIKTVYHKAEIKVSKSAKVTKKVEGRKKSVTKKDLILALSDAGILDKFVKSLEINYSPEVLEAAQELGFELGETLRKDVSISRVQELQDPS